MKIKVIKKGELVKKVEVKNVEVKKEVSTNWLEESKSNIQNQKKEDLICRNNWFGK